MQAQAVNIQGRLLAWPGNGADLLAETFPRANGDRGTIWDVFFGKENRKIDGTGGKEKEPLASSANLLLAAVKEKENGQNH